MRWATGLVLVGLLSGCGGAITDSPILSAALPDDVDAKAAAFEPPNSPEHNKLLATYGGAYENERMALAVNGIVSRLVAHSQEPNRAVRLTILNSPAVNAFALPSGDLYLTRGLITLAGDESELAAVIAHELGHVTADHARLRQRQARAAALARRVSDVVADPTIKLETRETADLSLATFSQRQEFQADEMGVRTLARAGYDPFAAARFLGSMARYASLPALSTTGGSKADFLSSHPTTPARVANARRVARGYAAPGIGRTGREDYLKILDGALYADDPRQGYVRGREFIHVDFAIAFEVPENYVLKNTSEAVLATDGQHTAIRFDTVAPPKGQSPEAYLASGWVKGLIPESIRTETVGGLDAALGSAVVDGWSFRIAAIRGPDRMYRFVFASSKPASAYEAGFLKTVESFRKLTRSEVTKVRPLRIKIATVTERDTIQSLSAQMDGVEDALKRPLFETLNGLSAERALHPGMKVKLVKA
ncbi:MAG: M48 family metalloprotease [Pseudomonadota bacterium]